ncbi:DUF4354 family protein [Yokenella regensburgei]|jgi:hypothetical protein|uniref:DUF4354 family protein n=1 Tax=Yokenella regensburgei TaxID=158877 RepID=UPI0002420519|nr:DUF4354 family protein [Yokenella regensburgei]EHM49118.1 hypothetical protein HMPREF0880_01943 [Yokenella regensburgei ATCC 43003]
MKFSHIAASVILSGFCFSAYASPTDNIAVYSTEKSNGSISIGGQSVFTKTFEVELAKLSGDTVDLSKLCLKAYSAKNKEYKLDTIDEEIATGMLKYGRPTKGIAVFASEDSEILQATLVKISADCSS